MIINAVCTTLLQLAIVTPFAIVARRKNEGIKAKFLIIAALLFIVTSVISDALSGIVFFEGQQWNWAGKAASLLIAPVFIFSFKPLTFSQFGLTTKIEWTNAKPIVLICVAYFFLRLVLYLTSATNISTFHKETIFFQATLPGLEEEIIFRGILLALLNLVFVKPKWMLAKVSFGWGAILTSLLFGLTHGVSFDNNYQIQFNAFALLRTSFDGFLFALLATKTKSLFPGIILHNALNLVGNH